MNRAKQFKFFIAVLVLGLSSFANAEQIATKFIKDGTVTAAKLNSGAAASGTVATANGSGGVSYQAVAGSSTYTQEIPSGVCDGSTTSFTLAHTPVAAFSVQLFQDELLLRQGSGLGYTISSSTITLTTACAIGQNLWAVYAY